MAKLKVQSFAKIPNEYVSIERSRSLNLLEEKLSYMLLNSMQKRWESTKKLEQIDYNFIASGIISFDDFTTTMQIGTKDDKIIYQSLKDLFDYSLAVRQGRETRFIHLFGDMIINNETRTINYKFGEIFIKSFTGICKDYFKLSVEEVIALHSTYAIRIYQMLKTKQNMDKKDFVYTIEELKKLLNIEDKYAKYNDLKKRVLELSKTQINNSEASQFNIDYEEIKTGRAVTSIQFTILPKVKNYYKENNLLPNYQQDQIKKSCLANLKKYKPNDVVFILSQKVIEELKNKKPSLAVVRNYWDTICIHTDQKN